MIVPIEVLKKLKCTNCENLLSCGPVFVKHDGSNLCGRCCKVEGPAVPNQPYNELAEMCAFPCKYEAEGCVEKLSFVSVQEHEQDCEFRPYICPVMASGSCEWVGSRNRILEHTQRAHPDKVLRHPCRMIHDVRKASCKTFLTTAFNVLFLIQIKICLASYTIYHSVRKIGEISSDHVFKYQVNIENETGILIRKCEVAPQGCLAMQEHSSLATKINTIMEALGSFNNTTFTITLEEFMKCFICKNVKNAQQIEVYDKINNIFYCKSCSLASYSCKNALAGCLWKGNNPNHETFLCTYTITKWCTKCKENIIENNILEHMRNKNHVRPNLNHLFDKYWSISKYAVQESISVSFKNKSYLFIYIKSNCRFFLQGCCDDFNIQCTVILRNPKTKYTARYVMDKDYTCFHGQFSFNLYLNNNKLESFVNENIFQVGVDIYSYE